MPRRVNPSQARSMLRQAQSKQRQNERKQKSDFRKIDNEIRQYNSAQKRAIDAYNREVRAHNSRVRANQARLQSSLRRLSQQKVTVQYTSLQKSVSELSTTYERLDNSEANPELSDLAERDTANSVTLLNDLLEPDGYSEVTHEQLASTKIAGLLTVISSDLGDRWAGAVFSLNPNNPDAARHFCSSAREIISGIFNVKAPDADVFAHVPNCDVTDKGTPTRRAKIHYCLERKGMADDVLESFVDANNKDLTVLFGELNAGTHGPAGKFSLPQLVSIKNRVEDAIHFMCEIAS